VRHGLCNKRPARRVRSVLGSPFSKIMYYAPATRLNTCIKAARAPQRLTDASNAASCVSIAGRCSCYNVRVLSVTSLQQPERLRVKEASNKHRRPPQRSAPSLVRMTYRQNKDANPRGNDWGHPCNLLPQTFHPVASRALHSSSLPCHHACAQRVSPCSESARPANRSPPGPPVHFRPYGCPRMPQNPGMYAQCPPVSGTIGVLL